MIVVFNGKISLFFPFLSPSQNVSFRLKMSHNSKYYVKKLQKRYQRSTKNRRCAQNQKITFRMETWYSCTLVLLPRLSPIEKIVHVIGDNFKPFFWTNWESHAVILFAFNYLRNSAVSPWERFPICPKKWLKIIPNNTLSSGSNKHTEFRK
jgi:hypothetical protein